MSLAGKVRRAFNRGGISEVARLTRLKAAHPEEYQSCVVVSIQQRIILQPRQVVQEPGQPGPETTD